MAASGSNRSATPAVVSPNGADQAEAIKAIRLRHPWRNIVAVVLVAMLALFVLDAAQREAYGWENFAKYIFDQRISQAAGYTLLLTVYSMVIAIILGVTLAVMRLSENPVVKGIAWLYLWVFRGTPVYVQLVFWGLFATIYSTIDIGIPFTEPWLSFETNDLISVFWLAVIGLALNESAYMAEIVRAGILSVDKGQDEAATALGMSWMQTMTRVVIPQAMRIIIPPTGNEVISMLKTTSLVTAIPFSLELYGRSRDISVVIFDPIPLLLVASAWYLLFTSILMVGQYFLEKRFSRGVGQARPDKAGTETGAITLKTGVISTPGAASAADGDAGSDASTDPSGKEHQ
ncbi:amino acid ABC transporter membrane protein (PAAT family) [Salinibacterium amurskyense]|uniref:Amino acid ABC transporter membrane protein (PAAT family) n=1 Tax=Salinibacterium amurskyense TaxID=205941 RepID=A0A2M9D309_9MICO|nr:amino acid ABC transporter permease [Salinibacterium amurskyense]PJJ78567.1 amino acid ABC transporter membrane protein (PAAT family) [Salinibacterium amurskyense]RLQ80654.1 amino acid ABC transporter permease [Salinibacterium amurskyense]GHD83011.1 ABC transporter permease [Salinibacterium amurskyense]